jgi:hypothetical protein
MFFLLSMTFILLCCTSEWEKLFNSFDKSWKFSGFWEENVVQLNLFFGDEFSVLFADEFFLLYFCVDAAVKCNPNRMQNWVNLRSLFSIYLHRFLNNFIAISQKISKLKTKILLILKSFLRQTLPSDDRTKIFLLWNYWRHPEHGLSQEIFSFVLFSP